MNVVRTLEPLNINAGRLTLSKDQARRRPRALKHLNDDVYEVVEPVQFKAGEVLGIAGALDKYTLARVDLIEAAGVKVAPDPDPGGDPFADGDAAATGDAVEPAGTNRRRRK